jgi:TonB family protein
VARLLVLFLLAVPLLGQDAAAVALLVNEPAIDAAALAKHIASSQALTRATAARVALVRDVTDALPALREVIATESNAEAAREQVRALALLGTADDVALAAKQLPRFPASLDSDFANAVLRRGAVLGTALYLQHRPTLRSPDATVRLALWGRSALATAAVAQFVGVGDASAFRAILEEPDFDLNIGVLGAALGAESPAIRTEAVWYLVRRYAVETGGVPESAEVPVESASVEEAFGREVLRRMRGGEAASRPEWLQWLGTAEGRNRVPDGKPVLRHLSLDEQNALAGDEPEDPVHHPPTHHPVAEPAFSIPIRLPSGLADAILARARCSYGWIGVAAATVDRAGRVQSLDLSEVLGDARCKSALNTMLRLSLGEPDTILAPLTARGIQQVKGDRAGCFDQGAPGATSGTPLRIQGAVKQPKPWKEVEPEYPRDLKIEASEIVIAEAVITKVGCVRDLRLVARSNYPQLNSSALLALSKWKFKPATLDGQPVDVILKITIHFRPN